MKQWKLSPTKQKKSTKKIFGFDIETYESNKKLFCVSLNGKDYDETFFNKRDFIDEVKHKRFKNSIISATNLQFDFNGIFFNEPEISQFYPCWRGSHLIYIKTFLSNDDFSRKRINKNDKTITFIDTLNYANLSVEKIGKILNLPKLNKPECLGSYPRTKKDRNILIRYNKRDAELSRLFIEFLFRSFTELGATPKNTIASTSMSLFKNKYLAEDLFLHNITDLKNEFKAYYGGRVEAFYRGRIEKCYYYDFNSLYPSVMRKPYPHPNFMKHNYQNTARYIESADGIANVDIVAPKLDIPLLPYRAENKLYFPSDCKLSGWYSNVELRKALELGYVITKVHENYYSTEDCIPFLNFVNDLYNLRREFKRNSSPMEYVIKILMNSLYGKFGQKFENREQLIPLNPELMQKLLERDSDYEIIETLNQDFVRIKKAFTEPAPFCIPLFALYTTAYGRLKLYEKLVRCSPYYCDTDSIISKKEYETSDVLGNLKLEMKIRYGVIVKPKFYAFVSEENDEYVKIKGLGKRLCYEDFESFLKNPTITYQKFMKFKESIRRGFIPNEITDLTKTMTLEDDKRVWENSFNPEKLEKSVPIFIKQT